MRSRRHFWRAVFPAAACAIMLLLGTGVGVSRLAAQVSPPVKPVPPDTVKILVPVPTRAPGVRQDTIKRPSIRDTTIKQLRRDMPLVEWEEPDSVMRALLARKGYRQVRYQGEDVRFNARTGILELTGKGAAVQRDETILVGDTIVYDDSAKKIVARGDTVTLRDPSRKDADDVVVVGSRIDYDMTNKHGIVGPFSTSFESGQRLYLTAKSGSMFTDTLVAGRHVVYARDGSFTYCDHEERHFHFATKEMKFVSRNIMVARPGVLYIGEVPVFWIPFFFSDVRSGRRSGILTPDFGIAELVRNSPGYRRQVSNIGYYFALSNYMDAEFSFDWRSGANGAGNDPGFIRSNGEYRYRWISRFISGNVAASQLNQNDGSKNLSLTWRHSQDFSKQTRITSNINWVQNTQVQRETSINPNAANATILSQLNYQTKFGPASLNIGGTRRQYPGRTQVETDFPNLNISTGALALGPITWTPGLRLAVQSAKGIDQGIQFPFVYKLRAGGGLDSTRFNAGRRTMTFGLETPIKIFDFVWQNSISINDQLYDYPEQRLVQNVRNPADSITRVFARTFTTSVDWMTSFGLPRLLQGTWNISPNISIANVDPQGGLFLRSERSGGKWVQQNKRLSYGVSASPALYAMLPGIGPIARFRHSISPSLSYSYSPASDVSDEFLAALGRTRSGYLGALANNRVTLSMSTNLEGKLRAPVDSAPDAQVKKINLLSLQFSSLSWDFIRADTAGTGLVESNFSIGARSDLLPGLDLRAGYSLFQGDPMSDTAVFKPFRQDVGATFSLDGRSGIFALLGRLIGRRGGSLDSAAQGTVRRRTAADDVVDRQSSQMSAAGSRSRGVAMQIPTGRGWSLNLQYNASRQRPPVGGTQIFNDPEALCEGIKPQGVFAYEQCVLNARIAPPPGSNTTTQRIGAPTFISRPTQNVTSALTFNVTPNWAAQWSTQYDVTRSRFGSQQVGLQRQMHDWNATFSFSQSPNGAFAFNFFIALKAQPELKFNYDRATYRSSSGF